MLAAYPVGLDTCWIGFTQGSSTRRMGRICSAFLQQWARTQYIYGQMSVVGTNRT